MNTTVKENFVLDKFTAVDFLTNGSGRTILLHDISWEEYEVFLDDFAEKPGWKLAFNGGKLEIMPPTPEHEGYSFNFQLFVVAYCDIFDLDFEGRGSTTFRSKSLDKGIEPDECFYIQSAGKIIGKKIAAKDFPMPDVAVEIDITTESLDKLPIYAALKVNEVWIYNGKKLSFYELEDGKYREISHSRAMPLISSDNLAEFLNLARQKGQSFALKSFRDWLKKQQN
jgi:Uma2 family endonuclease